jgi:iron complex outermembrane receptor protein
MEFDTFLYYVDHLGTFVDIPSYLRLDARLGWKPTESLNLSIGIRNMLDGEHLEFGLPPSFFGIEVERSVYGSITWRF